MAAAPRSFHASNHAVERYIERMPTIMPTVPRGTLCDARGARPTGDAPVADDCTWPRDCRKAYVRWRRPLRALTRDSLKAELVTLFEVYGTIERVDVPAPKDGILPWFAFVTFAFQCDAVRAYRLPPAEVGVVKPFRRPRTAGSSAEPPARTHVAAAAAAALPSPALAAVGLKIERLAEKGHRVEMASGEDIALVSLVSNGTAKVIGMPLTDDGIVKTVLTAEMLRGRDKRYAAQDALKHAEKQLKEKESRRKKGGKAWRA